MRYSLVALFSLALVALSSADFGSREFQFNYGSPRYSSSEEHRESSEKSDESGENNLNRHPSFYSKDVVHGMGPQHSFLTIDFPKPKFPETYKPDFQQHFRGPVQPKEEPRSHEYHDNFPPRYDAHNEQYRQPFAQKEDPRAQVSVVNTRDGKKIMTMTKPGYKMVVEEMEGKGDDNAKMIGRTVQETKSTKDKGDNGETMHQSQSYQYQVVQSESSDDKKPQRTHVRSDADAKGIDFSRFAQPQKNYRSEFPAQYGYQQHQEFVKAHQQQNPFGFQVPKAFEGIHIPPGTGRHIGF